jgi:hypothetical protein
MNSVAHAASSGVAARALWLLSAALAALVGLVTPEPLQAQWVFNPNGYLYPLADSSAAKLVDHVALLWGDSERYHLPRHGLYATTGRVYQFVSLVREWMQERHQFVFEFETECIDGVSYRFAGEFHNSTTYEDEVKDLNEVVASGELRVYEDGKLKQRTQVQWTYSPKPRDAKFAANVPYPSGKTDLMAAALAGNLDTARKLIAQGVDVDAVSGTGETALSYAVMAQQQSAELIHALLAAGANVNLGGRWDTPLVAAARKGRQGDRALVELLLAAGADVNLAAGDTTPLMMAAGEGDTVLVELLLAAGANVNAANNGGATALMQDVYALRTGGGSRESVKALLRAGADVNAKDETGSTALSTARANHDDETTAILLNAGAKE